jgi:pyruvate dehydrogenase E1 component beta subunit
MRKIKYNQAINEALLEEMRRDKCVFFMGEDIGVYHRHNGPCGVSTGLLKEFGEDRVIETPIAEQMILGSASGAAMCGLRPVVEIMQAEFLACGFEHVTFGAS